MPGAAIYAAAGVPSRIKGEAWLFVDVAVPAGTTAMTLTLDPTNYFKTPDATENPNALCLGCTREGWKVGGSIAVNQEFCDESPAAIDTIVDQEVHEIEAEIMYPLNPSVLTKLLGGTRTTVASTSELIEFGGVTAVPQMSVALVFRRPDNTAKYGYIMLYQCKQVEVLNIDAVSRKKNGSMKVRFTGEALSGRAAGKQYGHIYIQIA